MKQDLYKNITVIIGGFLVFAFIFNLEALIYAATIIAVVSALVPPFARVVNWLWLKLAFGLGWFNSRVLLTTIYFIFLFPIATISRLFTKNLLMLKRKPGSKSFYTERNHTYTRADLENIW
jgi:hypothetical protein